MVMNKIYGKRIRQVLILKNLTQKQLAIKLAQNEQNLSKTDKNIDDITSKYVNLINRWVNFKSEPELKSIKMIGDVLNISDRYLIGELNRPIDKYLTGEEKENFDNFSKEMLLFRFIEEYLGYDVDYLIKDNNGNLYPIFNKILDFTKCLLTKYLDDIGAKRKNKP